VASILLSPYSLSPSLELQNRLVMAPMTRCFAINHEPNEQMRRYYGIRGNLGLIISEATMIDIDVSGYPNTPGIFSKSQIDGWKLVCQNVHQKGGKFFLQLWHAGMMSHPIYRRGKLPISASNIIPKKEIVPRTNGALHYIVPKPMDWQDFQETTQAFITAALNAIEAGCDGIELHAANGYLLDSFLHYYSNNRTDNYGGNPENMSRFLLEVVDVLIEAIGPEKIGVRLSPVPIPSMNNIEEDVRDYEVFAVLLRQLNIRKISYVHVSSDNDLNDIGQLGMPVSHFIKKHFKGTVIGCGSYTLETGLKAIEDNHFELLAFGRLLIANPNLIEIIQNSSRLFVQPFQKCMLNALN
jgi:N-ethylmaleimide reductase